MTRSKQLIASLNAADPRVQASGFPNAIAGINPSSAAAARAIVPDGYLLDHEAREVVLYEVADTHPIRPAKAERIAELYDELEQEEWVLRVVVLDYTGHVVADVHGWAFGEWLTSKYAPPNCLDMTPAARAAAIASSQIAADQANAELDTPP